MARIMVVDDDPMVRKWVSRCLDPEKHQVVTVSTGNEFRSYFDGTLEDFDIVLMDILLPDLNGIEATSLLKSIDDPPMVIMLTSLTNSESMKSSAQAGADDFLIKPLRADELNARIDQAFMASAFYDTREVIRKERQDKLRNFSRNLEKMKKQNEKLNSELVIRLDRLSSMRDVETYEHTLRVGILSRMIAERLGLPEEYQDRIGRSAPLHDIGKTGIPDAILLKPGRLTNSEWQTMKTHTTLGWETFKDSSDEVLKMAADICHCHHERWNGNGYPKGLQRADIPLSAQITSVADSFDVIISARPYKKPVAFNEGFSEIKRCSGTQFSPLAVYAFLGLRKEVLDLYSSDFSKKGN